MATLLLLLIALAIAAATHGGSPLAGRGGGAGGSDSGGAAAAAPGTPPTAEEAELCSWGEFRLPDSVVPKQYNLTLDVPLKGPTEPTAVTGHVAIEVTATKVRRWGGGAACCVAGQRGRAAGYRAACCLPMFDGHASPLRFLSCRRSRPPPTSLHAAWCCTAQTWRLEKCGWAAQRASKVGGRRGGSRAGVRPAAAGHLTAGRQPPNAWVGGWAQCWAGKMLGQPSSLRQGHACQPGGDARAAARGTPEPPLVPVRVSH